MPLAVRSHDAGLEDARRGSVKNCPMLRRGERQRAEVRFRIRSLVLAATQSKTHSLAAQNRRCCHSLPVGVGPTTMWE
jgi:hypothetical protein